MSFKRSWKTPFFILCSLGASVSPEHTDGAAAKHAVVRTAQLDVSVKHQPSGGRHGALANTKPNVIPVVRRVQVDPAGILAQYGSNGRPNKVKSMKKPVDGGRGDELNAKSHLPIPPRYDASSRPDQKSTPVVRRAQADHADRLSIYAFDGTDEVEVTHPNEEPGDELVAISMLSGVRKGVVVHVGMLLCLACVVGMVLACVLIWYGSVIGHTQAAGGSVVSFAAHGVKCQQPGRERSISPPSTRSKSKPIMDSERSLSPRAARESNSSRLGLARGETAGLQQPGREPSFSPRSRSKPTFESERALARPIVSFERDRTFSSRVARESNSLRGGLARGETAGLQQPGRSPRSKSKPT